MRELTKKEQSNLLSLYDDLYRMRDGDEWRKKARYKDDSDYKLFQEFYDYLPKERQINRLEIMIDSCQKELKELKK